ncbi:hypothetical protein ACFY0N_00735 [Streptomyces vinaceus]|uniref:hypothetical protein n=1 Tax=Streptomyces vinaceus TaxID=1960 RepID=UPI0036AD6D4F
MTQTDISEARTEQKIPQPLPPYSGAETACIKCSYLEAFTRYRPACQRSADEFNGALRRGPLPERLERSCGRCDFQWDEALAPAPAAAVRPATIGELAHAIQQCSPYPVHPEAADHAARRMQEVLFAQVRTDHPMWAPPQPQPVVPGRPSLLVAPDQPTRPIPQVPNPTSAVPLIVPERVESFGPAGPASPLSTRGPVSPLGSAGFAQAAEG